MDLSQCSTTSGICHTGCSNGYTGGLCEKGTFKLKHFVVRKKWETLKLKSCGQRNYNHNSLVCFCIRLFIMIKPQKCCATL